MAGNGTMVIYRTSCRISRTAPAEVYPPGLPESVSMNWFALLQQLHPIRKKAEFLFRLGDHGYFLGGLTGIFGIVA